MEQKSLFTVMSPIMVGPSSSHTAGAVRLGLMARNIYNSSFKKVKFVLYNSFATTGFGHGTDKGLLAGLLGYGVDDVRIKNYVEDVIKCINQAYGTLTNEEKYNQAKKEIIEWIETEGLRIAESKLKVLIESAVSKNKKEV